MRWAKVPTTPLQNPNLSASDKLVFVALCAHANNGVCFPKRSTLALFTSLSTRTITASIANLCREGIITQELRNGTSALYRIRSVESDSMPAAQGVETDSRPERLEAVLQLFRDALPKHRVGKISIVTRFVEERQKSYSWYLRLFEEVSLRPFLCGRNDRGIFFPLSFIFREADEILENNKYAPWEDAAQAAAEFLRNGGSPANERCHIKNI